MRLGATVCAVRSQSVSDPICWMSPGELVLGLLKAAHAAWLPWELNPVRAWAIDCTECAVPPDAAIDCAWEALTPNARSIAFTVSALGIFFADGSARSASA